MFFSASLYLGSRAGSVGSPVAGCPRCAWVWSARCRSAAPSLALAFSPASAVCAAAIAVGCARRFPSVRVSVRHHRGRVFLRVRGSRPVLRSVALWWAWS